MHAQTPWTPDRLARAIAAAGEQPTLAAAGSVVAGLRWRQVRHLWRLMQRRRGGQPDHLMGSDGFMGRVAATAEPERRP